MPSAWSACFSDAACMNEFQDGCDDDNDEMHHIVRRSVPNVSFFTFYMILNPNLLPYLTLTLTLPLNLAKVTSSINKTNYKTVSMDYFLGC